MQSNNKWKTWHKAVLIAIFGIFFLFLLVFSIIPKREASPPTAYLSLSSEEKESVLNEYINSNESAVLNMDNLMRKTLLRCVEYPATTRFEPSPSVSEATISSVDSGYLHVKGKLTTKNVFGVEEIYGYHCSIRYRETGSELMIANIFKWRF
jgi:hypothetical protein